MCVAQVWDDFERIENMFANAFSLHKFTYVAQVWGVLERVREGAVRSILIVNLRALRKSEVILEGVQGRYQKYFDCKVSTSIRRFSICFRFSTFISSVHIISSFV